MEINLRINSKFTYLTFVIYKTCLSQLYHTCMKHKWGGYLHFTAIIPIKTVCKQFINGSVPFDYSLNSGFDTGMTADFAETLGRWSHLFRKCLQGGAGEESGPRNFPRFLRDPDFLIQKERDRRKYCTSVSRSVVIPFSPAEPKGNHRHSAYKVFQIKKGGLNI